MTRSEFVQISCDFVAEGRKRNFPDMRLSEAAAARVSDQEKALSHCGGTAITSPTCFPAPTSLSSEMHQERKDRLENVGF